jgi:serpin B
MTRYKRTSLAAILILSATLLFQLFVNPSLASAIPETGPSKKEIQWRVDGDCAFALDLYRELLKDPSRQEQSDNLCFSPHSLSVALAMTWAGAKEETARQMAQVLHLTRPPEDEHQAFARLSQDLNSAKALWARKGLSLLPDYCDLIQKTYGGNANELDFRNARDKARKIINAWVQEKTNGKIEELIQAGDLAAITELVLTNALYFKGNWASQFNRDNTKPRPFHLSNEKAVQVPMMYQMLRCGLYWGKGLKILKIPFEGGNRSMVIFLPSAKDGLPHLERGLSVEKINGWLAEMRDQEVGIYLPRFRADSRFYLKETLAAMGMPAAFSSERADFSGMTGWKGLFIDQVIHQARIEVDEAGAEAAAGSAVVLKKGPPAFVADHPFLYLIRNDQTGSILFMGRVKDPSS